MASSDDGIISKTLDGIIVSWNSGAERLYGYSAAEAIGKPVSILISPGHPDELPKILERLRNGEQIEHYETLRQRKDGKQIAVSITISPVKDKRGRIVGAAAVARDITERKRAEELRISEQVLSLLSARLLQVQDEERRRIAGELHGGVAQHLAILEWMLTVVGKASSKLPQAAQRSLSESLALVGECCKEIGNLAYLLHPPLLEELGLGPALQAHVNDYKRRLGLEISLELPNQLARLPPDVEMALFRITQEALTNMRPHSGGSSAEIRLLAEPCALRLEITDRGRAISQESPKLLNSGTALPGMGIAGMRERIRQLGGRLEIHSNSDGSTVRAILPLKQPPLGR